MVEEFDGYVPEIEIIKNDDIFNYFCEETGEDLISPCKIVSEKCYDCLGLNPCFINFYKNHNKCSCGREIDYGYFIIIYCLERADLLPKDFKMECCICKSKKAE